MPALVRQLALGLAVFATLAPTTLTALDPVDQAALAYSQGRYLQAAELLKKLPESEKPDPRQLTLLGLSLRRLHRDRESIGPLKLAVKLSPLNLDARINLALSYFSEGQWQDAQAAFSDAASAITASAEPWIGLGMLEATRRDWDASRKAYEHALSLDARRQEAWLALSDTLIQQGKTREAALAREKAKALIKAKDSDLHFKQAALWYGLGEIDSALKDFEASEAGSQPEALFLKGCLNYRKGDLEKAAEFFKAALEARPDYPEARLNLGITLYAQENFSGAMDVFREAANQDSGDAGASDRAEAYLKASRDAAVERFLKEGSQRVLEHDFPKALESWDKARQLDENPAQIQGMMDNLRKEQAPQARALGESGDKALTAGDLDAALDLWGQALQIDPKNPEALAGLKRAESKLDALKEAIAKSAASAATRGEFSQAQISIARLQQLDPGAGKKAAVELKKSLNLEIKRLEAESEASLKAGQFAGALKALDSAVALDPGRALLQTKRVEAKAAMRRALALKLAEASALEGASKPAEALKAAEEAVAMDGKDLEALRFSERLAAGLNISHAGAESARKWYYEGVYAYGAGKTKAALDLWLKAQKAAPKDIQIQGAIKTARVKLKSLAELEKDRP